MSILSSIQSILSTLEQDFQSWEQQLFGSGSPSSSSGSDLETLFLEMLLAEMSSDGSNSASLFGNSSNQPVLTSGLSFNSGSSSSGQPVSNSGSVQTILQNTAAQDGWGSGGQWQALQYVENREAGFNPSAINPSSGALGLAQALGHGNANTAGTLGNQYGGYGLTDAQARAANSGNAADQALWMVNYIKSTYGTPEAAAAHEQAYNWY